MRSYLIPYLDPRKNKGKEDPVLDEYSYGDTGKHGSWLRNFVEKDDYLFFRTNIFGKEYITGYYYVEKVYSIEEAKKDEKIMRKYNNHHLSKSKTNEENETIVFGNQTYSKKLTYPLPINKEVLNRFSTSAKFLGRSWNRLNKSDIDFLLNEIQDYEKSSNSLRIDKDSKSDKLIISDTNAEKKEERKVKPTGFWTFYCNPQKWAIDDFLISGKVEDAFSITPWQKDWFKKGQIGIIRVGHDHRTKEQLKGKQKLKRGIYAVVEVTGDPIYTLDEDEEYYYDENNQENFRVPIRYLRNLLNTPILIEELKLESHEYDKYMVEGFQASSMPLNPQTLRVISELVDSPMPFEVGNKYSKKEVYNIFEIPEDNVNSDYTSFNKDIFLFANINSFGSNKQDNKNNFLGDELHWYSESSESLSSPSIQAMLNPVGNIYIFTRDNNDNEKFVYQGNGKVKRHEDTKPVKFIWKFNDKNERYPNKTTEELDEEERYMEGAVKQVTVNVYERNPVARKKCIEHYGSSCLVCNFNFEEIYGDLGNDFIHVHHLRELHTIGEKYEVDPIKDLRPVCPNCHAMIHRKKPAYSIEDIKALLEK